MTGQGEKEGKGLARIGLVRRRRDGEEEKEGEVTQGLGSRR